MTDDADDELDRLRLALLHERSRAERAEHELAELKASTAEQQTTAPELPAAQPAPTGRLRRRRR
jgi:hypothetical protein